MNVSIIGAGAFGTAIANSIDKSHHITLYTRNKTLADHINAEHKNPSCFPHKKLSKKIVATHEVEQIGDADVVLLCLPSYGIPEFIQKCKFKKQTIIINGSKGFSTEGITIPEYLNANLNNEIGSLKGPSFASELILEVPTSFTLAASSETLFHSLKTLFRKEIIVLDFTSNIKGVELVSILKNVYAIVLGISDACFNSPNTRFLTFTKAWHEMHQILEHYNISPKVLNCFAGIGDFGLTSLNDLSRNRTLGLLIGKGFFANNINNSVILEGIRSVKFIIQHLPEQLLNDLPLIFHLNELFNGQITTKVFMDKIIFE
jgi:glycerol-3-phosphate dehydrogenase (NAD(P)+)